MCRCREPKTHNSCAYCGTGDDGYVCGVCHEAGIDGHVIRGTGRVVCREHRGAVVFVYGTLKKDMYYHARMMGGAEFQGEATLKGKYRMYTNGYYPIVVEAGILDREIKGEVFSVDNNTLKKLDGLELGSGYERVWVTVHMKRGRTQRVQMYLYNRRVEGPWQFVESGNFQPSKARQ